MRSCKSLLMLFEQHRLVPGSIALSQYRSKESYSKAHLQRWQWAHCMSFSPVVKKSWFRSCGRLRLVHRCGLSASSPFHDQSTLAVGSKFLTSFLRGLSIEISRTLSYSLWRLRVKVSENRPCGEMVIALVFGLCYSPKIPGSSPGRVALATQIFLNFLFLQYQILIIYFYLLHSLHHSLARCSCVSIDSQV